MYYVYIDTNAIHRYVICIDDYWCVFLILLHECRINLLGYIDMSCLDLWLSLNHQETGMGSRKEGCGSEDAQSSVWSFFMSPTTKSSGQKSLNTLFKSKTYGNTAVFIHHISKVSSAKHRQTVLSAELATLRWELNLDTAPNLSVQTAKGKLRTKSNPAGTKTTR